LYWFVPKRSRATPSNTFIDGRKAALRFNGVEVFHPVEMKTYVINLARRKDRLKIMSAQLSGMGLSFERVPALDASEISDAWLTRHFERNGPLGPIPKGDQCCSLSHRRAWSTFLASGERYAVILEDDVLLDDAATDFVRHSDWFPSGLDLLKLEHFGPEGQRVLVGEPVGVRAGRRIARIHSRHTGAAAYVISRDAAKALLASDAKWSVPVDHLLFNPNVSDVAVRLQPYQLLPAIARQKSSLGGASDIRQWRLPYRRPSIALVKREIVRAYYELRLLPQQLVQILSGDASLARVGNERLSNWQPSLADETAPRVRSA
jgi:glycosyl transferase family 25